MRSKLASPVALLILLTTGLFAQDWTQWRGPSRSGATASFKAPATWPERPTQVWKVQAGTGHSSPVVGSTAVFLHSRIADQEAVTAYELATGKQIWRQTYGAPYEMNPAARGHGKGPKSTPVLDGGRLFTYGISGVLSAWHATSGRLLWRKDFKSDFPVTSPDFGVAMSPVVVDGLLVVHAGGPGNGAIFALDPVKGDVKWRWNGDAPGYSSPIVATIGGTRQVITQTQRHVVGVALADGSLLWQIPFSTAYDQNIVTAVVSDDLVVYSGIGMPLVAVRIGHQDRRWTAQQVWQNAELPMYMSSPVLYRGHLYGLTARNRGQFFSADLATGKITWTTRGREGENAAVILIGDHLMAATTEGELVIAKADPKAFEPIRRYTVAESPVWAHPIPAGRGVLIKDAESLAYWTF
jgi:outer membrane protein assembly factor BamB